jgi:putative ABC transport system permease protein
MVSIPEYTVEQAARVAATLEYQLDEQEYSVRPGGFRNEDKLADPNESSVADTAAGIGVILQSIGVISVILGLLLIYNTITAIITQQTAQIGELKAVGAGSGQILVVYFTIVFVYGLFAALFAVPLGILAANVLRFRIVSMLGSDVGPFTVAGGPVLAQIALCLVAPLLIAALPILQGARITVREAMSSYGLSSGGSKLDEALGRMTWLSRAMSLAISNTFRNRQRVILTQLALAGAGVTFMAVISARSSLVYSVSDLYYQLYPASIQFSLARDTSDARLAEALQVADVSGVEVWRQQNAYVRPSDQAQAVSDKFPQLIGVPVPTTAYQALIRAGRWLEPGDTYAVVLHQQLAQEVGVGVGDWVTISIPDNSNKQRWLSQQNWQVVGLLLDPSSTLMVMLPRATLAAESGHHDEGNKVQIATSLTEPDAVAALAQNLRSFYEYRGIDLAASTTDTLDQRSARFLTNVNTISTLLILMAVIVAAVGGIALSGVLSIGVLERRREIGVLRAIGATPRTILSQFVAEGLMMGWLSWLIALALSYPAGSALVLLLSGALQLGFVYQYAPLGVALWLLLATIIGVFASWSPAQGAINMSVQESLAYE